MFERAHSSRVQYLPVAQRIVSSCVEGGEPSHMEVLRSWKRNPSPPRSKYVRRRSVPDAVSACSHFLSSDQPLDASAASIKLAWDPSPDPLVTGYRLYYGRSSGMYTVVVDAGNRTDYTVTGLDAGLTYYFTATAYTGTGDESIFSNETSYTLPGGTPCDPYEWIVRQRRRMLHRHGGLRKRACARGVDAAGVP